MKSSRELNINGKILFQIAEVDEVIWITCHSNDKTFRTQCYRSCRIITEYNNMNNTEVDIDTFLKMYELKFHESLSKNRVFAMKHAVNFKTVGPTIHLQLSKLMDFFISIVKIIKYSPRTLAEIKRMIDVNNSFFFEFGSTIL